MKSMLMQIFHGVKIHYLHWNLELTKVDDMHYIHAIIGNVSIHKHYKNLMFSKI